MPRSAADPKHWPADWHTIDSAAEVEAEVGHDAGGFDIAKLGVSAADWGGLTYM